MSNDASLLNEKTLSSRVLQLALSEDSASYPKLELHALFVLANQLDKKSPDSVAHLGLSHLNIDETTRAAGILANDLKELAPHHHGVSLGKALQKIVLAKIDAFNGEVSDKHIEAMLEVAKDYLEYATLIAEDANDEVFLDAISDRLDDIYDYLGIEPSLGFEPTIEEPAP